MAFAIPGYGWCVSENMWSRTTGKHLNQSTPIPKHQRVPHDEFKRRLAIVLAHLTVAQDAMLAELAALDVDLSDRKAAELYLAS